MVFDRIEQLKREFTDKYVLVDETRPELRRFRGQTGVVKTVNMSGRALVQFDALANIGWYDIDLDFLKIVDQPLPRQEAPATAKPARQEPPQKAASKVKKPAVASMSVDDILAAARGKGKTEPAQKKVPAADQPAAMSVADVLAAARGETTAPPAKTEATPAQPPPAEIAADTTSEPEVPRSKPDATASSASDGLPTETAEIVAWCRQHDSR